MARNERLYGSVEEPYCYLCSRPTDHAGEHTTEEELRHVAWSIVFAGTAQDEDDRPDSVPNMYQFLVALKDEDPAATREAIVTLFESGEAYISSGIIREMELLLGREWKVAS